MNARREIWWSGVIYGVERSTMASALEAATAMILEKEFGFDAADVGFAVGCTILVGAPLVFLVDGARRGAWAKSATMLVALACACATAAPLLSTWASGSMGLGGFRLLLLADALI